MRTPNKSQSDLFTIDYRRLYLCNHANLDSKTRTVHHRLTQASSRFGLPKGNNNNKKLCGKTQVRLFTKNYVSVKFRVSLLYCYLHRIYIIKLRIGLFTLQKISDVNFVQAKIWTSPKTRDYVEKPPTQVTNSTSTSATNFRLSDKLGSAILHLL